MKNIQAREFITQTITSLKFLLEEFLNIHDEIDCLCKMAEVISDAFRRRKKVFLFGNGGSAADAQHIAAEFVNKFELQRPPLPAISLTTDTSIITSVSNDFNFKQIFVKQLKALSSEGDIAFGISTSGRSENVISALKWAKENHLITMGFAGKSRTDMDIYCDFIIHVPSDDTPRIQECHILLGHILCGLVERMMYA